MIRLRRRTTFLLLLLTLIGGGLVTLGVTGHLRLPGDITYDTIWTGDGGNWDNPGNWSNGVPGDGANVLIPSDFIATIWMGTTVSLGTVEIDGELRNYGTIQGGTFNGQGAVKNYGGITSGTFSMNLLNGTDRYTLTSQGSISGGTFNGKVTNTADPCGEMCTSLYATISGGTFNGAVHNGDDTHQSGNIDFSSGLLTINGTLTVDNSGGSITGATSCPSGRVLTNKGATGYVPDGNANYGMCMVVSCPNGLSDCATYGNQYYCDANTTQCTSCPSSENACSNNAACEAQYGSKDCAGLLDDTSCGLHGTCTWDNGPTMGCQDLPNLGACTSKESCTPVFAGGCGGLTQENCSNGCSWTEDYGNCGDFGNGDACNGHGCTWYPSWVYCSNFSDQGSCDAQGGHCTWDYGMNSCQGEPFDIGLCGGGQWDMGTGSCGGTGPYSGCSGMYQNMVCSGTYTGYTGCSAKGSLSSSSSSTPCVDIDPNYPAWNSNTNSCDTCVNVNADTPYWNGSQCISAPSSSSFSSSSSSTSSSTSTSSSVSSSSTEPSPPADDASGAVSSSSSTVHEQSRGGGRGQTGGGNATGIGAAGQGGVHGVEQNLVNHRGVTTSSSISSSVTPTGGSEQSPSSSSLNSRPSVQTTASVTRAEAIHQILQQYHIPVTHNAIPFRDVTWHTPYAEDIGTAAKLGIVHGDSLPNGRSRGTVRPNDIITQSEFSLLTERARALQSR